MDLNVSPVLLLVDLFDVNTSYWFTCYDPTVLCSIRSLNHYAVLHVFTCQENYTRLPDFV